MQSSRTFLFQTLQPHQGRFASLFLTILAGIAASIATPFVSSRFIDGVIGTATSQDLVRLAIITIILAFAAQIIAFAETWFAESLSWDTTNAVRIDLIRHVLELDTSFHTSHTVGELIDRVDGDVSLLARFLSRFVVVIIGNALLILAVLAMLTALDLRIGIALGTIVMLTLAVLTTIRKRATPFWQQERDASANWYGELGEQLDALEDIQAAKAAPWVLRQNTLVTRIWYTTTVRAGMMGYAMAASTVALFGIGTAIALGIAVMQVHDNAMTIGEVYLVLLYTLMLRRPVEQIRNELQDFQQADASIQRVVQLLSEQPALSDTGTSFLPTGSQPIVLDDVTFSWNAGIPVLHDISLTFEPGRVTGIVGRTGGGKTTLTRLVCRMIDPDIGSVAIGGVDLRDVSLAQIRQRVGVMSQDVRIIHASLRDNLTWFDPAIGDDHLIAALAEVGLSDWLNALPDGLDTWLGTGGRTLSAGEAQLLACTRILLRDPDIVILDEASSRLDPVSERNLHQAIARVTAGRTTLIVAHRLETMAFADDILVLDDGRVLEHGSREALMSDPHSHLNRLIAQTTTEGLL